MDSLNSGFHEKLENFRAEVYLYYRQFARKFPWRENIAPWGILVSEFMLQQTQTERVVPFFQKWMRRWPSPEALNGASLEEALAEWVGLGYNRRCRFLKECARIITTGYGGQVPSEPELLRSLPGIGAYTAGAIACFAYNYPAVFIETNIRSAVIHFFFDDTGGTARNAPEKIKKVSDAEIFPILEAALDRENPRLWHWALMDYGANLKKLRVNPNRRSAGYSKQSRFDGSLRQIRGRVVRMLSTEGASTIEALSNRTGVKEQELYNALEGLQKDAMVSENSGIYRIKD
jgi:A/G-specific adenine glycosylase